MTDTCSKCGKDLIKGKTMISSSNGMVHEYCHYKDNPPKVRTTFVGVLCNIDDQVTVRDLLDKLVPPSIQKDIICRFNKEMLRRYYSRMKWFKEELDNDNDTNRRAN